MALIYLFACHLKIRIGVRRKLDVFAFVRIGKQGRRRLTQSKLKYKTKVIKKK